MNIILLSVIVLGAIGLLGGVILFFIAQKFKVYEDPKIDEVEGILPAANCGGCGFPGCRNFAESCVKAEDLGTLFCPVGGNETMAKVASILGKTVEAKDPQIAVIRCNGTPEYRQRTTDYDGATTCAMESALYSGHTDCQYGCLGHGDCVDVCKFDAIYIDEKTLLPIVSPENCTACGACVDACPKDIIELRPKGKKDRRIFVSCVNHDRGGTAKKSCQVACTGCKSCVNVCKFDAITIDNFLAYINPVACKLCRACVTACPTNAIWELNFPPRKVKTDEPKKEVPKKEEKNEVKAEEKTIDLKEIAKDSDKKEE
ncbi:MAG: Fe-S cluster domain-containing protein [Paludibacteraceae bacterium]|nr:Fe-S cluster domain-containing protein [Paludibacteraceae bacterium]